MSQENVEIVRQPMPAVRARSRRSPEERFFVRFPRAFEAIAGPLGRLWERLPPSSRLRRAMIRRSIRLAIEALNRDDHESIFLLFHPDCEASLPQQLRPVGGESTSTIRGREERVRVQREWREQWDEFRFEVQELIDLGDRVLLIGRMKASGSISGAPVDNDWADLVTLSEGRVISEQNFINHAEALEAAGLRE